MGKIFGIIQEGKEKKDTIDKIGRVAGGVGRGLTTAVGATGAGLGVAGLGAKIGSDMWIDSFKNKDDTIPGVIKKGGENLGRIISDPNFNDKLKVAKYAQDFGLPVAGLGAAMLGGAIAARLLSNRKKK